MVSLWKRMWIETFRPYLKNPLLKSLTGVTMSKFCLILNLILNDPFDPTPPFRLMLTEGSRRHRHISGKSQKILKFAIVSDSNPWRYNRKIKRMLQSPALGAIVTWGCSRVITIERKITLKEGDVFFFRCCSADIVQRRRSEDRGLASESRICIRMESSLAGRAGLWLRHQLRSPRVECACK